MKDSTKKLLANLASLPGQFQPTVDDAAAQSKDMLAAAYKYQLYLRLSKLDRQIDDLDYLLKRGQYRYLRDAA